MADIRIFTNDAGGGFQSSVIAGLREVIDAGIYHPVIDIIGSRDASIDEFMTHLEGTAGIVVIADAAPDDFLREAYARGIPITLVSHQLDDLPIPAVMSDDGEGIKALMYHLIMRCGRRSLVFVRGIPEQRDSIYRESAFRRELLRYNVPDENFQIVDGLFVADIAADSLRHLLKSGAYFDAILAADYLMGIAALEVLRDAGIEAVTIAPVRV